MHHGPLTPELAQGRKVLRERIEDAKIPSSKLDETLNLATWNVRELGKNARWKESIHYVAEILGQFDVIALTELRAEVGDLKRIMDVLGPTWRIVYSVSLQWPVKTGHRCVMARQPG